MKAAFFGCLGAIALTLFAGSVFIWYALIRELPLLDAKLALPSEAALDSPVEMVITVTNPHQEAVTLDSIDISEDFLAGFHVTDIEPEPMDTMHIPILNQRSWYFDKGFQPGETQAITFKLKSVVEGNFSGSIDVCNPNQDFKTLFAQTMVKPKLSANNTDDAAAPSTDPDAER